MPTPLASTHSQLHLAKISNFSKQHLAVTGEPTDKTMKLGGNGTNRPGTSR